MRQLITSDGDWRITSDCSLERNVGNVLIYAPSGVGVSLTGYRLTLNGEPAKVNTVDVNGR